MTVSAPLPAPTPPPLGWLPRHIDTPNPRMECRAQALRDEAAEVAFAMGQTPAWQRDRLPSLLRQHESLCLRAVAAECMGRGDLTLAQHYLRSARRIEREAGVGRAGL